MDNFQFTLSQALKATELGLRTCWMALTFKGSEFIKGSEMPADQPLRIISPVGYDSICSECSGRDLIINSK